MATTNNIEKYLNASSEQFSPYGNGTTYKNDDAFYAKGNEICYISEDALNDLEDLFNEGKDLTDEQLIEQEYAETYNTIVEQIKSANLGNVNVEELAEQLYVNADWAYIATYILELGEICEEN